MSKAGRATNRAISSQRVGCENVIARLERFNIIAGRYRNRRKRFGLRCFLICAISDAELPTV